MKVFGVKSEFLSKNSILRGGGQFPTRPRTSGGKNRAKIEKNHVFLRIFAKKAKNW